jgi:hypothetical protein
MWPVKLLKCTKKTSFLLYSYNILILLKTEIKKLTKKYFLKKQKNKEIKITTNIKIKG